MARARAIRSGILQRERLFALLDGDKSKAVWICGPPGAGKTTLASSWLEARRLRCLWYRAQAGDGDLASFFYELGARAGRRRAPLPAFTPEYRGGEAAFARRFFRELAPARRRPWALALDDLHQVASPEPLFAILGEVLEDLPPWGKAILVSREQPPAQFARILANRVLSVVEADALRLTPAEALTIAQVHAPRRTREELERMCRRAAGWAGGLVLLATSPVDEAGGPPERGALFPYLARELLERADPEARSILADAAVPPLLPARIVNALCGSMRALAVLEDLARRACFVTRRGREDPVYELHPLAREFLLERARSDRSPEELRRLEKRAADLLAETGRVEDAIDLYARAEAWAEAAQLVLLRAPHLVATGRIAKLGAWLDALPPDLERSSSWLSHWRGVCRLVVDPATAREHLARAWAGFDAAGDVRGLHLSFSAAIESIIREWGDLRGMDEWIARFEAMARRHPPLPKSDFALRSATAMCAALTFRRLGSEALPQWEEHALGVVLDPSLPPTARLAMGSYFLIGCAVLGEGVRAAEVVRTLAPLARAAGAEPIAALAFLTGESVHFWHGGAPSESDRAASLGLEMAGKNGIHAFDFHLQQQRVLASLAAGEPGRARERMPAIEASLRVRRPLRMYSLLEMEVLLALHEGDGARAITAARDLARVAKDTGLSFAENMGSTYSALALVEAGDAAARSALEALRRGGATRSALLDMIGELAQAEVERRSGDLVAAREHLERGLRVSREKGIAPDVWFSGSRLGEFCALALDGDVEVEHVLKLVRRLGLGAPPGCTSERWPWSVRARLFGPFEVLIRGRPLRLSGARHRPLDVLPALVARGACAQASQAVAAALWPESDGDLAHHALETATYRLRRLVGGDIVQHREGEVRLDTGRCWVDALALETLLTRVAALMQRRDERGALASAEGAISLYRGPFLEGREEPWALSARERYRLRVGRSLSDLDRFVADREPVRRLWARAAAADPNLAAAARSAGVAGGRA